MYRPIFGRDAFLCCLAFLVSYTACGVCDGQTPEDYKARFLEEAPRAWRDYYALAHHLQGKVTWQNSGQGVIAPTPMVCETKFNDNGGWWYATEELVAYNREYSFRLTRKSAAAPWAISGVNPSGDQQFDQAAKEVKRGVLGPRMLLYLMDLMDLPDLVKRPHFQVVRADPVERNGLQLVKVEFKHQHSFGEVPFCLIRSGVVFLEPARFWCLHGGELQSEHSNGRRNARFDVELQTSPDGKFPIPRKRISTVELIDADNGEKYNWTETGEYQDQVPAKLPGDAEFTLTAFGFPEPPWLRKDLRTPTRWWLWLAVSGFALVLAGLGFGWLKRRSAR